MIVKVKDFSIAFAVISNLENSFLFHKLSTRNRKA